MSVILADGKDASRPLGTISAPGGFPECTPFNSPNREYPGGAWVFWMRGRDLNPRPSGYEPDEWASWGVDEYRSAIVNIRTTRNRCQRMSAGVSLRWAVCHQFVIRDEPRNTKKFCLGDDMHE